MAALTLMHTPLISAHAERAHAMKNCLGVITMIAELLDKGASRIDHDRLQRLRRATSRLCHLLELDLGEGSERDTRSTEQCCSVEAIVCWVMDHVADRAEHANVKVVTHSGGGLIDGDQAALGECLLNLLVNAIDASAPGGVVSLCTQMTEDGDQYWTVRDDGRGMSTAQLQRLGKSFSSTKSGGWGLGLAVVQHTVALHGGAINVRSDERAGTTFAIWLPRKHT